MLPRRLPSTAVSVAVTALSWRYTTSSSFFSQSRLKSFNSISFYPNLSLISFSSTSDISSDFIDLITDQSSKRDPSNLDSILSEHLSGTLKTSLYALLPSVLLTDFFDAPVFTRHWKVKSEDPEALRVLKSADVILSEDTRHSGKLLHYYSIKTPLLSNHKYNESQREQTVLKRLKQGEIIALISDAGMPGISDPGTELDKICVEENIPVIPIPGPSAFLTALSASGLSNDEFTFVGFLPKHASSRKERLMTSASEMPTQIFYVPPHKLSQFLEESSLIFGDSRQCVIARKLTKMHEEFWRGTLGKAKEAFLTHQPKGEITLLIEGNSNCSVETPSESRLENNLRELISNGHILSSAVKLVAEGTSMKKKTIYSLALRKFSKKNKAEDSN